MNKTQRLHAIKRVLREDFSIMQIERLSGDKNYVLSCRLRNGLRTEWANKIEKALSES